ncbi:MAG: fasciclin domain-containing protein, partial [Gemmatimonadales bacterium]
MLALVVAGLLFLAACSDDDSPTDPGPQLDLLELAEQEENFDTFLELAVVADLDDLLSEDGPWTVFAPVDAAFEALPQDLLDQVTGDPEVLRAVLENHIVEGEFNRMQVMGAGELESLYGATLTGTADGPILFIDGVEMVETNLFASNGVI